MKVTDHISIEYQQFISGLFKDQQKKIVNLKKHPRYK